MQQQCHDTDRTKGKLAEPTVCPDCGVSFENGRWRWGDPPANAHLATCPACHRLRDDYPAGFVSCGGPFFKEYRDELLSLVRNKEERQRGITR